MKKTLFQILTSISLMSLFMVSLVACQPNKNNKDENNQEIQYARLSYDRCLQINHYEMCNAVRSGAVLSLKEYYGMNTNYNANGYNPNLYNNSYNMNGYNGYNVYNRTNNFANGYYPNYNTYGNTLGYNNYSMVTQYSAQQIEDYFNNYVRRATKEEILDMAGRWNSGNTTQQYNNPYYRSCGPQGCM